MKSRCVILKAMFMAVLVGWLILPLAASGSELVQDWELANPAGITAIKPIKMAPRLNVDTLAGKTIGLKWNQKPNGDIFLDRIAELLKEKVPNVKVLKFYELEPSTVPQSSNAEVARRKAEIIASYKPDIVIGVQCD